MIDLALPLTPIHPGYIASRIYATQSGVVTAAALASATIDVIYWYGFILPKNIVFTGGKMRVQTAGAGSSVKAGIWADSPISHRPLGAPLYKDDTGVTTQASTTDIVPAIGAGSLQAGVLYWFGSKYTGTLPAMWGYGQTAYMQWLAGAPSVTTINGDYLSSTDTYSNALPTLAEGATFTGSAVIPPGLWLTT